jgi:hypothetical protein
VFVWRSRPALPPVRADDIGIYCRMLDREKATRSFATPTFSAATTDLLQVTEAAATGLAVGLCSR